MSQCGGLDLYITVRIAPVLKTIFHKFKNFIIFQKICRQDLTESLLKIHRQNLKKKKKKIQ